MELFYLNLRENQVGKIFHGSAGLLAAATTGWFSQTSTTLAQTSETVTTHSDRMSWMESIRQGGVPEFFGKFAEVTINWYSQDSLTSSITGYMLVNPVSITKYDANNQAVEQIQAARAQASGKLLASDTFAQSSYTSWTKSIYNNLGYLTAIRQYHLIPTSGDGVKDTNYLETTFGYDLMGQRNKTVSPDGTITRTVLDWQNNPIQTWIGTNDTGATDTQPKPANQPANNMVIVTETEYGGGVGCSTCSCAKGKPGVIIQHVDGTTMRVTEFGYDWRGRQIHIYGDDDAEGNMTYTVQTYDNLDRVVKSERFLLTPNMGLGSGSGSNSFGGGTGGTQTTKIITNNPTDDILLARSEQFYDTRGRVWKTEQSVVDPASGVVQG